MSGKSVNQWAAARWSDVIFGDGFWGRRVATNRRVTLPIEYQQCEQTGRLDAFKLKWKPGEPNQPHHFWDSDVAKWVEAAAYSLASHSDASLEKRLDHVIDLIAGAQQADGYLNVYFTVVKPGERWTNLRDMHELYCAGHLIEAAVAVYVGTGKRKLLEVMCRYADHIDTVFGDEPGKKRGYPGHEEIELALVKLYRVTGEKRYLKLAKYFVDERGQSPHYYELEAKTRGDQHVPFPHRYFQAEQPVRQLKTADGHAVRALYLYSGMADVAAETGDRTLLNTCRRLWENITTRRMYITGGVGSTAVGEKFTFDYDLPNETAYAETCAAIAMVMFAHRILQVERDGRYADVMERTLYNGVMSGVSLKGDRFFYANPLAVSEAALQPGVSNHVAGRRQKWFGCACCPPNLARLLASLGQYVLSSSAKELAVHLYVDSTSTMHIGDRQVTLRMKTKYPWGTQVKMTVAMDQPGDFTMAMRVPGWCDKASLKVNGQSVRLSDCIDRGYAKVKRTWRDGDVIELELPMEIRRTYAHPKCRNDAGKVAVERGPVVYCLEEMDAGGDPATVVLPRDAKLTARYESKLLGGVTTVNAQAMRREAAASSDELYRPAPAKLRKATVRLVPYALWTNRREGRMNVWLNEA